MAIVVITYNIRSYLLMYYRIQRYRNTENLAYWFPSDHVPCFASSGRLLPNCR